jgi:uridine phosphorylase
MALSGYRKDRPSVLGQHTCASIAKESGKWRAIPYLRENEGMLPPNMIVVGDRRRVLSAAKMLAEPILLHEEVENLAGPNGSGRVNLALGIFLHEAKPLPVTILETQMGCSAQDINAWEALVLSREDGYSVYGMRIPASGINVIRAGTCGGIIINDKGKQVQEPFIGIGDVVNGLFSFGDGAAARQRLGCGSAFDPDAKNRFRKQWRQRGYEFTEDRLWPVLLSSRDVVAAISEACMEAGLRTHEGGNFTKESLYLESDEEWVMDLRRKYGVLSTEMEHFGLAFLAHELTRAGIPVHNGLVSCVVGTVPGGSFAAPGSVEEAKAKETENQMLKAAMTALWKLAHS